LTYDDVYESVVRGPHTAIASLRRKAGRNAVMQTQIIKLIPDTSRVPWI